MHVQARTFVSADLWALGYTSITVHTAVVKPLEHWTGRTQGRKNVGQYTRMKKEFELITTTSKIKKKAHQNKMYSYEYESDINHKHVCLQQLSIAV